MFKCPLHTHTSTDRTNRSKQSKRQHEGVLTTKQRKVSGKNQQQQHSSLSISGKSILQCPLTMRSSIYTEIRASFLWPCFQFSDTFSVYAIDGQISEKLNLIKH